MATLATTIDPVEGLVRYVEEIKPYHSKVLEVLVEYIYTDCIDVTFTEEFELAIGLPSDFSKWGWDERTAEAFFHCGFKTYQIADVNSDLGYFEIVGDFRNDFFIGSPAVTGVKILAKVGDENFTEYTVSSATVITTPLTVRSEDFSSPLTSPGSPPVFDYTTDNYVVTRIFVAEGILPQFGTGSPKGPTAGIIVPSECYTLNPISGVYTFRVGMVFPSKEYLDKFQNCGGYGDVFQQAGSPTTGLFGATTPILGVKDSSVGSPITSDINYFEIDNTSGVPAGFSTWSEIFVYGAKVEVTGSSGNNGDYVVLNSYVTGSPQRLRIYVTGGVSSSTADGSIGVQAWGYDEPTFCVDPEQAMLASSHIAENMQLTINDVGIGVIQGWDMFYWDIGGYDGGPITFTLVFT